MDPVGRGAEASAPPLPPFLYQSRSGVVDVVVDGGGHVAWDAVNTPVLPLLVELCKSLLVQHCCSWCPTSSARNSPTFCPPGHPATSMVQQHGDHPNAHQNCWHVLRLSWSYCQRWASKRHLTTVASLVLKLRRFGGRSGMHVPAVGGRIQLKEPEYRGPLQRAKD